MSPKLFIVSAKYLFASKSLKISKRSLNSFSAASKLPVTIFRVPIFPLTAARSSWLPVDSKRDLAFSVIVRDSSILPLSRYNNARR